MIDFSIVDAHLHLWDITKLNYPWLNDIPALNKTFSLDDYNAACGNIKVGKSFFRNALNFYRISTLPN
ncbi:MAG: hypothetical protein AAB347_11295 [Bacteroidota bacterium]